MPEAPLSLKFYAPRSFIDIKMSAMASVRGLAPRLPLPWTRTLTALASMSRLPITKRRHSRLKSAELPEPHVSLMYGNFDDVMVKVSCSKSPLLSSVFMR